ncbi:MAG: hypothetical protein AW10_03992 [Candidatus Accumulibacter appositus]|uniref:Uncharacterized protein n=1 Tax=Candidatus Accumulibacter appositus TaxID=1454003 RepID=A0A011NPB4_9PROT|nr:MAG: hypothetical protein AW10_03992 [Candidatus Accumulibacter appositus]
MHYELRLAAPSLGVLPLAIIANAIARAAATAGGTPLHKPTYQGKLRKVSEWIIDDARAGRLAVTDQDGRPGTFDEVIERAKNDGTYSEAWQSPTSSEVDLSMTQALCIFTTLLHLNEWAREQGDEFSVSACGWIDERGWVEPHAVIENTPTVIFLIDGREAIPVRAIPLVTGWEVSPDLLASSLAHSAEGLRLERLAAYQLHSDGSHTQTLPKEWDGVDDNLKGLSATLRSKNSDRAATRPEWLRKSIPLLPAGVFVWKDDFEKSFWRQFSADSPAGVINLDGKRPGDGELNYAPLISQGFRKKVCKGFAKKQIRQTIEIATSGTTKNAASTATMAWPDDSAPRPRYEEQEQRGAAHSGAADKTGLPVASPDGADHGDRDSTVFVPRIGWQLALFDSWPQICRTYSRQPTPAEAVRWLRRNDSSGTIVDKGTAAEMWWCTQQGHEKKVSVHTVESVISQWRVKNLLPI